MIEEPRNFDSINSLLSGVVYRSRLSKIENISQPNLSYSETISLLDSNSVSKRGAIFMDLREM